MRKILLFGAGKSSVFLIDYFLQNAMAENWVLTVADVNPEAVQEKIGNISAGKAVAIDIQKDTERKALIQQADIVISLLPPSLHILVAKDCILFKKHLLTASYIDEKVRSLKEEIQKADLLFLCEMGLDPGIDHMSAKQLIDAIHADGGKVRSFLSHCGGLVAPESDDNPWHYKISWNPRNVVLAGKDGAIYKEDGLIKELDYPDLFGKKRYVLLPGHDVLCWYPNRDSLRYISLYGLEETRTFIRTTLRHPDFIYGWKNIIDLKLTDTNVQYETNGKTLLQFFKEHMNLNSFGSWLDNKLHEQFDSTSSLLSELINLVKLEDEATQKGIERVDELMVVDDKGDLQQIDIDQLKIKAAATLADRMHDANLTLKQLFFLGMDDDNTYINKGACSAADVLQFALETKLMLQPHDRDMVVMQHEIEFEKSGTRHKTTSTMVQTGNDAVHTAMAKTVGLPLALATKLILNGTIISRGLQIPTSNEIYEPVLKGLEAAGITFREETVRIS